MELLWGGQQRGSTIEKKLNKISKKFQTLFLSRFCIYEPLTFYFPYVKYDIITFE